ncbi:protein-ER retention protein [Tilletia horrida]|nr:protein-ER retention protein [Tilletia horrida]
MRFRWSYYYDDLEDERRVGKSNGKPAFSQQPASAPSSSSSSSSSSSTLSRSSSSSGVITDPTSPRDNPLLPHIPYLVFPSYSGDVLAIDYHAARAAAAASSPDDVARIARDEANYAAEQLRQARVLARQQREAIREARADRKAARRRRRMGSIDAGAGAGQGLDGAVLQGLGGEDDLDNGGEVAADRFDSVSFLASDLLPQSHGPPLGALASSLSGAAAAGGIGGREEEAAARRRAAAIVRLGSGTTPSAWIPPAQPARGLFSFGRSVASRPSKPIAASMAQRMAALGTLYSLGVQLDTLSGSGGAATLEGASAADEMAWKRGIAGAGGKDDIWSLSHSSFSAWFPPPYRVLTLVALGILIFAIDVLVLSRLGIDPVPLLFPASAGAAAAAAGARGSGAAARGSLPLLRSDLSSNAHGLGPGLASARQLSRALFLLGAVYVLLGLGGWASFRIYVDSVFFLGDPSGRHAQALQGLAITIAIGLACWPGHFLFRPIRVAFWKALGRLFWPSSFAHGGSSKIKRSSGPNSSIVTGNGVSAGAQRNGASTPLDDELAEEMGLFGESGTRGGGDDDADDDDERELLSSATGGHGNFAAQQRHRAGTLFRRFKLAVRDTRRWVQPPTFSAVILADVLTSFAKVFADVWLTACFLVPRKEHHTWWNGRGSVVVPILTSLPYLIRLRQCISEYLSTTPAYAKHPTHRPSRRPLWNALKYFSALPVIWLAALEGFASSELAAWEAGLAAEGRMDVLGVQGGGVPGVSLQEGTRLVRRDLWTWGEEARWRQRLVWRCWLFWVFFNSIFSFWWDVTYDWGLDMFRLRTVSRIISSSTGDRVHAPHHHHHHQHHHNSHHHRRAISSVVLRPETKPLLFPEWAYHLSIVLDLILRFTWSIKLSSQLYRYADWEGGVFVFEALEIIRRGAWVVLRFEHAALTFGTGTGAGAGGGGGGGGGGAALNLGPTAAGATSGFVPSATASGAEERLGDGLLGGYADDEEPAAAGAVGAMDLQRTPRKGEGRSRWEG